MAVYNKSGLIALALIAWIMAGCQPESTQISTDETVTEAKPEPVVEPSSNGFVQATLDWRERRMNRLTEPYGWLSLVGMHVLETGHQRLGSGPENDIVLPGGPEYWGQIVMSGGLVMFESADPDQVTIDGQPLVQAELLAGGEGVESTRIESDGIRVQLSRSADIPNLRVRSSEAETRTRFVGLDYYEPDPNFRFEAEFVAHEPGKTMRIANVLGQIIDEPNPGIVRFEHQGQLFELETFLYGDELFIVFADRTSGNETYGLGRFLYADLPVDGKTVVDFNLAYNPPCAFTQFTTCSMPPQSNRMDTRIAAGEKTYRGSGGVMTETVVEPSEEI